MTFAEFKKFYLLKEPQVLCFIGYFFSSMCAAALELNICLRSGPYIKSLLCPTRQECNATKGNHVRGLGSYPDSIDWRKKGHFVSDVKNQVV